MSVHHQEQVQNAVDALSLSIVVATLASWLPPLSALVSIVWVCIRIYETDTVQRWLKRK